MINKYKGEGYLYTISDIAEFIKTSTTLEELEFLRFNIKKSSIGKNNKDILLTMIYFKYFSFTLFEIEGFYKDSETKPYGLKNEEGLTKSEVAIRTKKCPHCNSKFRIDKESHFQEKSKKPKRIHEKCIKDYVRNKYNISQNNIYNFINNNYIFIENN